MQWHLSGWMVLFDKLSVFLLLKQAAYCYSIIILRYRPKLPANTRHTSVGLETFGNTVRVALEYIADLKQSWRFCM